MQYPEHVEDTLGVGVPQPSQRRCACLTDAFALFLNAMIPRDRLIEAILCSPEVMSGTPVFRGTRVPIQTLMDHLEAGDSLDVFLADFPTVTREQAVAVLEMAKEALLAGADAALAR